MKNSNACLALRHMQIKGADKEVVMHQVQPHDQEKVGTNGGTMAGLVGTPEMIAERLRQFESLGIETFLLQFHPRWKNCSASVLRLCRYCETEVVVDRLRPLSFVQPVKISIDLIQYGVKAIQFGQLDIPD